MKNLFSNGISGEMDRHIDNCDKMTSCNVLAVKHAFGFCSP